MQVRPAEKDAIAKAAVKEALQDLRLQPGIKHRLDTLTVIGFSIERIAERSLTRTWEGRSKAYQQEARAQASPRTWPLWCWRLRVTSGLLNQTPPSSPVPVPKLSLEPPPKPIPKISPENQNRVLFLNTPTFLLLNGEGLLRNSPSGISSKYVAA